MRLRKFLNWRRDKKDFSIVFCIGLALTDLRASLSGFSEHQLIRTKAFPYDWLRIFAGPIAMRVLGLLFFISAFLSDCVLCANAQESKAIRWSGDRCDAAYAQATTELFVCMAKIPESVKDAEPKKANSGDLRTEATEVTEKLEMEITECKNCMFKETPSPGFRRYGKDILFQRGMKNCIAEFDGRYRTIGASCGRLASINSYCKARNAAASQCSAYCSGGIRCGSRCGTWIAPPGACKSPSETVGVVSCEGLPLELLANCLAGHPELLPKPPSGPSLGGKQTGQSRLKRERADRFTRATPDANSKTSKTNLDRFDLGPTFVSPDSSSAVSRTARSAGSSKTHAKTTGTSDAKSPKTSGAPMAAGGGIQGTVKTTGTSDASKPSKSQKSLTAPIVGGTQGTVKEQIGGTAGTVKDPIK